MHFALLKGKHAAKLSGFEFWMRAVVKDAEFKFWMYIDVKDAGI